MTMPDMGVDEMLACGCGCSRIAKAEIERLRASIESHERWKAEVMQALTLATQAAFDVRNRLRDFDEVARRIATNTRLTIEEARSIARRQDEEARRLGAVVDAAVDCLDAALSNCLAKATGDLSGCG